MTDNKKKMSPIFLDLFLKTPVIKKIRRTTIKRFKLQVLLLFFFFLIDKSFPYCHKSWHIDGEDVVGELPLELEISQR